MAIAPTTTATATTSWRRRRSSPSATPSSMVLCPASTCMSGTWSGWCPRPVVRLAPGGRRRRCVHLRRQPLLRVAARPGQARPRHPGHPALFHGRGYILVGADGGAFSFGSGVRFHGSLPEKGVQVADIVGSPSPPTTAAITWPASKRRSTAFGDAQAGDPTGVIANLPVAAIAGT